MTRISLAGITFILGIGVAVPYLYKMNLKNQQNKLDAEVKISSGYAVIESQFKEVKKVVGERQNESERISKMLFKEKLTSMMEKIERAKYDKLFLQSINYSGENTSAINFTISGVAQSDQVVATFIVNLKKNAIFNSVELRNISKQSNNSCIFTLYVKVDARAL